MSPKQWCFNEVLKNTPQGAEFVCNHECQQSSLHDKAGCVSMTVFLMGAPHRCSYFLSQHLFLIDM